MPLGPQALRSELAAYVATKGVVSVAYLFGSHARGQAGPLSDVDVAVLLDREAREDQYFAARLTLMAGLEAIVDGGRLDVVILNEAPLALAYRILRDGILVACRDEDARITFTARTVSMYLDFSPVIERHERAILERAREGKLLHGFNPHRGALERYRRLRQRLAGSAAPEL